MPKGYNTLSVTNSAFEHAKQMYKKLEPHVSFSRWMSQMIEQGINYEQVYIDFLEEDLAYKKVVINV